MPEAAAAAAAPKKFALQQYKTEVHVDWCPGCGDFGILSSIQQALFQLQIPPYKVAMISGIGCSGKTPHYIDTYGLHTLHGRALPVATGAKLANNQLTVVASLQSTAQQVVADNIVQLKAQYGKDNGVNNGTVLTGPYVAGDGVVDSYDTVTPATAAAWNQLLTIRIGLVARSAQPEKPSGPGPACDTTTTQPSWSGGNFNLSANANWMCYRYKVFETVIPVKNILWTQG